MKHAVLCTSALVSLLAIVPALAGPPVFVSDSTKRSPSPAAAGSLKALTPPSGVVLRVAPGEIVQENVRATAALYAASLLEEMKIFDVVDKIVDAFHSGLLPIGSKDSRARLDAYYKGRVDRLPKSTREELGRFATGDVRTEVDQKVSDMTQQMEAYGALVQAVTDSVEQFRRDNTTESQGRDTLADRFPEERWKVAADLARSLSSSGYGAAQFAAAKLEQQARDMIAILSDPAVQEAYGTRGQWELVEKLGGKPASECDRLQRRADAGSRLIGSLADNVDLLDAPKKRSELAKRLVAAAPYAKAWLAVKPARAAAKAPPKLVRPLCLDDKRDFVPCTLTRR